MILVRVGVRERVYFWDFGLFRFLVFLGLEFLVAEILRKELFFGV